MKKHLVVLFIATLAWMSRAYSEGAWTFTGGPWHSAFSSDIAIGYRSNGQAVMYTVRLSGKTITKSTDGGDTWIHLPLPNVTIIEVFSIACEENNPDVLYLGIDTCSYCGKVYKSTNGGSQWTHVLSIGNAVPARIAISRVNPQLVYVGVQRPGFGQWTSLWYSEDGGATWHNHVGGGFLDNVQVSEVVLDPTDLSYRYAAVSSPSDWAGCWRTIDGGALWRRVNQGNMTALAIDPQATSTLYAGIRNFQTNQIEFAKSTDRGEHWSSTSLPVTGGIMSSLKVNEQQPNILLAGTDRNGVFRSTDRGQTWSPSNTNMYDQQVSTMAIDKRNGSMVFAGTSTAFYRSVDGGVTWTEKTKGITRAGVASLVARDGLLVTNAEGLITFNRSTDFGQTWIAVYGVDGTGGDNEQIALSHGNSSTILASRRTGSDMDANDTVLVLSPVLRASLMLRSWETQGPDYIHGIYRSTNKGLSWGQLPIPFNGRSTGVANDPNSALVWYDVTNYPPYALMRSNDDGSTWQGVYGGTQYGECFAIDPSVVGPGGLSQVSYLGVEIPEVSSDMLRTTNAGSDWEVLSGFPSVSPRAIAVDPFDPQTLYAGTFDKGIYKSTDRGGTWYPANAGLERTMIVKIVPDTKIYSRLYALRGGFGTQQVYLSENGGQSWVDITSNLAQDASRINDIAVDYIGNLPILYTGTDHGIYRYQPTNFWQGTITQNTTWSGTVYVIGDVTVANGATLTVQPGTTVKVFDGFGINVSGTLQCNGQQGQINLLPASTNAGSTWRGITFAGGSSGTVQYTNFTKAATAIKVPHNIGAIVSNCIITTGTIGIHLYEPGGPSDLPNTEVRNNTISGQTTTGILVDDGASNAIIQDNTLTGIASGDVGIRFINASPLQVVRNRVTNFAKGGFECKGCMLAIQHQA